MIAIGCLTGIILYVVGSILERHERAQREREWQRRERERWGAGRGR